MPFYEAKRETFKQGRLLNKAETASYIYGASEQHEVELSKT